MSFLSRIRIHPHASGQAKNRKRVRETSIIRSHVCLQSSRWVFCTMPADTSPISEHRLRSTPSTAPTTSCHPLDLFVRLETQRPHTIATSVVRDIPQRSRYSDPRLQAYSFSTDAVPWWFSRKKIWVSEITCWNPNLEWKYDFFLQQQGYYISICFKIGLERLIAKL